MQLEKQEPSEATSVVYKPIPIPSNPSDTANMDWMEESYESLPPEISHQNLADHESQKEEICINLPPDMLQQELAPLEEQRWYWEGMSVSEADKKLSGAPDGTFLVCDSQTEGKHILVVRKDKANEIIHISQADGMYGFFDMSVLPRKPILAVFPTIPALVEYFKHVPLMKYSECLDVTLAYPVSRIEEVSGTSYKAMILGVQTRHNHTDVTEPTIDPVFFFFFLHYISVLENHVLHALPLC